MRRGEIWTCAGGADYVGKPRPVVIVQSDDFQPGLSITVCPFTTSKADTPTFRVPVEPDHGNGLRQSCSLMVDKITTLPRTKLGRLVGCLGPDDMLRVDRALRTFLAVEMPPAP